MLWRYVFDVFPNIMWPNNYTSMTFYYCSVNNYGFWVLFLKHIQKTNILDKRLSNYGRWNYSALKTTVSDHLLRIFICFIFASEQIALISWIILLQHASNQVKHQKSKLLIYDEYLNKYVGADELLIPGVKVPNLCCLSV